MAKAKSFKVGDRVESLDREFGKDLPGWPWGVVERVHTDGRICPVDVRFGLDHVLMHTVEELRPDTRGQFDAGSLPAEPTRRNCVPANQGRTTLPADSAERKLVPLYRGPVRYFPAALAGVARVCEAGNRKHNPDATELTHDRAKSTDQEDCILRHLVDLSEDYGHGVGRDEAGIPQVDYIAWRALALAQAWHEEHDGVPVAPAAINAKVPA
jgi:hypothetical protein